MKVKSESEVTQSCLTLSDPMDCSLPVSSVHGIFQARVLEWGAIAFSASLMARQQMRVCLRSSLQSPSKKVSLCEGVCTGKKVSMFLVGLTTPAPGAPKDVETRLFRALEPRPQERLLLSPASVSPYSQQKTTPGSVCQALITAKASTCRVCGGRRPQEGHASIQKIHQHHHLPAPAPGWVSSMSC